MFDLTNINFVLILFEGVLFQKAFSQKRKFPLVLVSLQLILLLGMRNISVGGDSRTYDSLFRHVVNGGTVGYFEIGNRIVFSAIANIWPSTVALFLVYAILTVVPIAYVAYKESENIWFSMMIYAGFMYYYWAFNAMRQAVAMSIEMLAIYSLNKKRKIAFLLFSLVAISFHSSAVIILLCYFINNMKIKNRNRLTIVVFLSLIGVLFGRRLMYIIEILFSKYSDYMAGFYFSSGNWLHPILYAMIFCFAMLVKDDYENLNLYSNMLGIGVVLYFLATQVKIVNRLTYYFTMPAMIILLPNIINSLSKNNKKIAKALFYSGISVYQLLLIISNGQGIIPYRFFWQ